MRKKQRKPLEREKEGGRILCWSRVDERIRSLICSLMEMNRSVVCVYNRKFRVNLYTYNGNENVVHGNLK